MKCVNRVVFRWDGWGVLPEILRGLLMVVEEGMRMDVVRVNIESGDVMMAVSWYHPTEMV